MVDMLQNSTSFGRTGFLEAVSDTKQVRMSIPGLITGKFNDGMVVGYGHFRHITVGCIWTQRSVQTQSLQ